MPGLTQAASATAPLGHLSIRRGAVPQTLSSGVRVDRDTEAAPGLLLFNHPKIGRFLARDGREIVVEPTTRGLGDLMPFVMSSGFAAICIQRSLVLLHASAVAIKGNAIAFAGPRGAGKSTLLGAFIAAGYTGIADDLSLIEPIAEQPPRIWPVPGYLRLWPNSARALGLDERSAGPELSWSAKLQLSLDTKDSDGPWPLSAICLLADGETDFPSIEPLESTLAGAGLMRQLFRPHYIHPLGQLRGLIPKISRVIASTRVFRISRSALYDHLPATIDMVRRALEVLRSNPDDDLSSLL